MSIHRYAARVDANQSDIVSALRKAGAYVWIVGLPVDLLCGVAGQTILVEIKTLTGKRNPKAASYTPLQEAFMRDWLGGPVVTVTDVEGALRVVAMLKARGIA